jgi:hypothetical protein
MSAGKAPDGNGVVALILGANAGLKNIPVKLATAKRAISANGANLRERRWGLIRANFIQYVLHVSDGPGPTDSVLSGCAWWNRLTKNLQIETATLMAKESRQLLFESKKMRLTR